MREYELCCEIFNQCSNNQMRDVDFQEVSVEDTDAYIRALEPRAKIEREELNDARWFSREELPRGPQSIAIASAMIQTWLDRGANLSQEGTDR